MTITNWLLIRGLAREKRHWGPFPEVLQENFPNGEILALDLPGFGGESHIPSKNTIEKNVTFLREKFVSHKNSNDWGVIGISLGGMIALKWSEMHPEDFKGVVTINSSSSLSPFYHRLTPYALSRVLKVPFLSGEEKKEEHILHSTTNLVKIDENLIKTWASFSREKPINIKNVLIQLMAAKKFNLPKKITTSHLALCSKGDHFTNYKSTLEIAKRFGSGISIHPSAGHDLPLDDPEWVAREIKSWVEKEGATV